MSFSLIKVLSSCIFIAKRQNKTILAILLKDYAKTQVEPNQFIFILIMVMCYEKNNILLNDPLYKFIDKYISKYSNTLCKKLLY